MNGNSYYITPSFTSFIPCNTDSYYSVITSIVYQTCPKCITIYVKTTKRTNLSLLYLKTHRAVNMNIWIDQIRS